MASQSSPVDIVILSNGPGEITTWVRPVVAALRRQLGHDRNQVRISVILSPCPNASGKEVAIAQSYPEVDRVQGAQHFLPFLLWGKTAQRWKWRDRGVVLFLGGDQFFTVIIGKRLGYRTVIYGEWDTRWHRWIDRFGVMNLNLIARVPPRFHPKFTVVGDLMAEAGGAKPDVQNPESQFTPSPDEEWIGLLPGSKAAKLAQGVPLSLASAERIHAVRPTTRFVIPVAPTLDLNSLVHFADPERNPVAQWFGSPAAHLRWYNETPYLETDQGLKIQLYTGFPAYEMLAQCRLCITTIGANTAELGALGVPMIVLLPTQQLDAMRAWDGLPGLLANLPGVGTLFAKLINGWFLRKPRLLAWPNIWAQQMIVPELVGKLEPRQVAELALDWLEHPEKLTEMRDRLRAVRGQPGAAEKLAALVYEAVVEGIPPSP